MILPAQTIAALCQGETPLITPFEPEKLRIRGKSAGLSSASYDCRIDHDLTLGVNPAHIIQSHLLIYGFSEAALPRLKEALLNNPPCSALAYTVEDFCLPADISAAVCDKSSYARVFVSAFNTFFDPGFVGNATLELTNLGSEPVTYTKGDPVCQFIFSRLEAPTDRPYDGKYQHQTKAAHGPRYELEDRTFIAAPPVLPTAEPAGSRSARNEAARAERDARQDRVEAWVQACFGPAAVHPYERAERVLEEALELAQTENVSMSRIWAIAQAVYDKAPGTHGQEAGGLGTCLLAYCQSRGISADGAELKELERITALPPEHFRTRHAAKVESGLAIKLADDGAGGA